MMYSVGYVARLGEGNCSICSIIHFLIRIEGNIPSKNRHCHAQVHLLLFFYLYFLSRASVLAQFTLKKNHTPDMMRMRKTFSARIS